MTGHVRLCIWHNRLPKVSVIYIAPSQKGTHKLPSQKTGAGLENNVAWWQRRVDLRRFRHDAELETDLGMTEDLAELKVAKIWKILACVHKVYTS